LFPPEFQNEGIVEVYCWWDMKGFVRGSQNFKSGVVLAIVEFGYFWYLADEFGCYCAAACGDKRAVVL
jgi:hypothetical protein